MPSPSPIRPRLDLISPGLRLGWLLAWLAVLLVVVRPAVLPVPQAQPVALAAICLAAAGHDAGPADDPAPPPGHDCLDCLGCAALPLAMPASSPGLPAAARLWPVVMAAARAGRRCRALRVRNRSPPVLR